MGEEEEEGKRTMEDRYKELRPHFASISLVTPPLDAHKIIHFILKFDTTGTDTQQPRHSCF
jgi:hypothetical protein